MTQRSIFFALATIAAMGATGANTSTGYVPPKGGADATTATIIGRAVLIPIYGTEIIMERKSLGRRTASRDTPR